MLSREISNFERGMLVGIPIGAIAGPSIALVIFVLIVCYDLGRPKIVDIGQNLLNKHLGLDLGSQPSTPNNSNLVDLLRNATEEERNVILDLLSKSNAAAQQPSHSSNIS